MTNLRSLLAAAIAAATLLAAPATAQSAAPTVTLSTQGGGHGLNALRRSAGLAPLAEDPRLTRAAAGHAAWMARNGTMSHSGANGSSFADRASAAGYCYRMLAENVAYGTQDPGTVLSWWMSSTGHRRNILNPGVSHYGLAAHADRWVLLVAAPC
ncbi:putative membrane protein [Oceanicola granulosus HTCC2516]|uniref:Putative membrane protein n=1 Tax=Oceanicola granulosus (strain ATCC BAA-861 / DSM 15982 / KCTC 12143 / HTCC2516) TaxID=314256 RepID=Q2CDU4_OCEGH|nr:CAP domain-containing protein [Oceanicola granulosus]EAR50884.1 putative membrane protein [Oceanicola granulosus HTCC2516]